MTKSKILVGIGFCGVLALGCDARTNLSGDYPTHWSTIGAGGSGTCAPLHDDQPFTPPAGVSGTWTGYFQGTNIPVGEDGVNLIIDQADDGSNQIHVVFGAGQPPSPATVATDPYPADIYTNPAYGSFGGNVAGFPYSAHEVQWIGPRLKFTLAGTDAWDSWCKLQQSYWTDDGLNHRYACAPGNGLMVPTYPPPPDAMCNATYNDNRSVPFDCDQILMCLGDNLCACDECGCAASASPSSSFDLTFDGDTATGVGPNNFGSSYLRLTRSAN